MTSLWLALYLTSLFLWRTDSLFSADKVTSLLYFLSGALVFTIILSASLLYSLYKIIKGGSCHCTESQTRFSAPSTANAEGDEDSDNLHYAALRIPRVNPTTKQSDEIQSHCVYSSVRP
ncbi:hypothetical protein INR49_028088 [Caranx melampygus]|nr:hypothetical protein INR49_028088 [Caranx melampygus]